MNDIVSSHTSQTATGALIFAVGAAMAAGQPAWPVSDPESYMVIQTTPTYSHFSEQFMVSVKQPAHVDFARDIAAIYASLSERQEPLGDKFEAAIFDDLDSLYES